MGSARERGTTFHGLVIPIKSLDGAKAVRVVHGPGQTIEQHRHDWACMTFPVLGTGTEFWDGTDARIDGPCAVLHPPQAWHADTIGDRGLETLSIQFDPRWLAGAGFSVPLERSRWCVGGALSAGARLVVRAWTEPAASNSDVASVTAAFLHKAGTTVTAPPPRWLKHVTRALEGTNRVPTAAIAAQLDLSAAWLARAYRSATGEGIQETVRRKRAERAVPLLRQTSLPLAEIAAASGFCDQSHMTRDFRALTGRTPLQVRNERALF